MECVSLGKGWQEQQELCGASSKPAGDSTPELEQPGRGEKVQCWPLLQVLPTQEDLGSSNSGHKQTHGAIKLNLEALPCATPAGKPQE